MSLLLAQKTAQELIKAADQHTNSGYFFAVLAFVLLGVGVGLSIYFDRRKKQRTK